MTNTEWNQRFGEDFFINLSNEERRYFALNEISPEWDRETLYFDAHDCYQRMSIFFYGNTIVKVIVETQQFTFGQHVRCYGEDDTKIDTVNREFLLRQSDDALIPLSVSNIHSLYYLCRDCSLRIYFNPDTTFMRLRNARTMRTFPLGEDERISGIRNDADFHHFTRYYMDTCRDDYFQKLAVFKSPEVQTVSYRPGDIFRMNYDRTRYCYGLIIGAAASLCSSRLPENHWLKRFDREWIVLCPYQLITENPDLSADDLREIPLGYSEFGYDRDITTGIHPIVDHKPLEVNDVKFQLTCQKLTSFLKFKKRYSLLVEWGFAHATLKHPRISPRLKRLLAGYVPINGFTEINPRQLVNQEFTPFFERSDICSEKNTALRNELFACLGLPADCTFDQFAKKFGGISTNEILAQK